MNSNEFGDEIQMNLLMNFNEFVDELKWIYWWIQMNSLMSAYVDEFKWIIDEIKWTY